MFGSYAGMQESTYGSVGTLGSVGAYGGGFGAQTIGAYGPASVGFGAQTIAAPAIVGSVGAYGGGYGGGYGGQVIGGGAPVGSQYTIGSYAATSPSMVGSYAGVERAMTTSMNTTTRKVKDDHPSKFKVTVVKLETEHGDHGADWFVKLKYDGDHKKTSIKKNAGHGTTHWHESFTFDIKHGHELKFEVEDEDSGHNDHLGKCDLGHKPEHYPHGHDHHHDKHVDRDDYDYHRGKLTVKLELIYGHHDIVEEVPIQFEKRIVYDTVYETVNEQQKRIVYDTVYETVNEQQKRIVYDTVYETVMEQQKKIVYENVPTPQTRMVNQPETVLTYQDVVNKVKDSHASKFKVTVVKLETKHGDHGADWFVKLKYAGHDKKTSVKKNAGHGTTHWHESFEFDIKHGHELKFEVEDEDAGEDDHLGKCDLGCKPEHYSHGHDHHHDKHVDKDGHRHHRGKLTVKLELIYGHHHENQKFPQQSTVMKQVPVTQMINQQVAKEIFQQVPVQRAKQVAKEVIDVVPKQVSRQVAKEIIDVVQKQVSRQVAKEVIEQVPNVYAAPAMEIFEQVPNIITSAIPMATNWAAPATTGYAATSMNAYAAPATTAYAAPYAAPSMNAYAAPSINGYAATSINAYAAPATTAYATSYAAPSINAYAAPSINAYAAQSINGYAATSINAYTAPAINGYA